MSYAQTTRAQFRTLLRERLGAANTFWRDTELNFLTQESLRFFNLLTGFWKTRATVLTVINQLWMLLPSTITSNMRVSWQGLPLSPTSAYDLDFGRPNWTSETTITGGDVPTQPKLFVIGGLTLIALWPSDAAGGNVMTVDGIAATPILTSDAQQLDIGLDEQKILLDYCQHVATFKEGGKELADSQALLKSFLKACAERNGMLKASAVYRKYMGLDKSRFSKPLQVMSETGAR